MQQLGLRMMSPHGRAVQACIWVLKAGIDLGRCFTNELVRAVRLRTERDARLAGAPGAAAANLAVLLGLAICHGRNYLPRLLPAADGYAVAVEEAGRRARDRRDREGDGARWAASS